jgi:hypothetical protein
VISPIGCAAVRIPVPEKFAIHKLLVSQLRVGRTEKSQKDLRHAAIIIAVMAELHAGATEEAFSKTPVSARSKILKSLGAVRRLLEDHPQALDEVDRILGKHSR